MRKLVYILILILATSSLAACKDEKKESGNTQNIKVEAKSPGDSGSTSKTADTAQGNKSTTSKSKSTPELEQKLFDTIRQWKGLDTAQRVENLKKVIDEGADVNAFDTKTKITPLMAAAMNRNQELIDLFLENGADINKLTEKGENVLFYCFQDEKILNYLISKGADPNVKDKDGKTYKDSRKLSSN